MIVYILMEITAEIGHGTKYYSMKSRDREPAGEFTTSARNEVNCATFFITKSIFFHKEKGQNKKGNLSILRTIK